MSVSEFSRRDFIAHSLMTGAGLALAGAAQAQVPAAEGAAQPATRPAEVGSAAADAEPRLRWLESVGAGRQVNVTCGMPWPRGTHQPDTPFAVQTGAGQSLPTQTWPLAYWPDGSLKWTAHAVQATVTPDQDLQVVAGRSSPAPKQAITVRDSGDAVTVDTGVIRCRIGKRGADLIEQLERDGRPTLLHGKLVAMVQDKPSDAKPAELTTTGFESAVEKVTVEQDGPIRAVVKIEGKHAGDGRAWLPFTVRLYFHAGDDQIRVMHTFIFDGEPEQDFIRGLGLRFDVPMTDPLYERYVRFAGEEGGLWAEAVKGVTGLRRDPGQAVRQAQVAGQKLPPLSTWDERVTSRLQYVPAWNQYSLSQLSADGYQIRKRTADGQGWIGAGAGRRAPGVGYLGGPSGGVGFGVRHFWQTHPSQIDIRGAAEDVAQVTLWLWAPESRAMDTRFYHDGMGMETFDEQLEGLNITYEDYQPEWGTAHGIARTNEMVLWAAPSTPSNERIVQFADLVSTRPQLVPTPPWLLSCQVFTGLWSLPDRSTPAKARIEDTMDFYLRYYQDQVEARRWYGFWDFGDVMHSYDADRHVWRYDVGGYAWDNSELSPDLWLWYSFLRSGRADVFRFAEAMTRHTGEVDVYHLGRFKGFGSRHNVQHWGCSAKQMRISTAIYRRFYYYLTADERVGDLMHDLVDAYETFMKVDPIRKIREGAYDPQPRALSIGFGTDWGSLAMAWLIEWERTLDEDYRNRLINGMKTIAAMPFGVFDGGGTFDPITGRFAEKPRSEPTRISHLNSVFGFFETCVELIQTFDVPEFDQTFLDYCTYYNADRNVRHEALGFNARTGNLTNAHSRLTAWAAARKNDAALAERAWNEFYADDPRWAPQRYTNQPQLIDGPASLRPVQEAAWVSTNDASQWNLAAIQNLAMIGGALPVDDPRTRPSFR